VFGTTHRGVLRTCSAALAAFCVLSFSACSTSTVKRNARFAAGDERFDTFGAREIVSQKFEDIDLAGLLSGGTLHDDKEGELDQAFKGFEKQYDGSQARRNAIQERILAASEQRCASYKQFLKQFESENSFILGAITTILAGAGALVSPVIAARSLAGSAAVMSGVNAEFQEKFFARLTIQVLTKAMDARRKNIYEKIVETRKTADLTTYPVEAAVKDALAYHGACSLIAGLEEAGASIDRATDPGAEQLKKHLKNFQGLRDLLKDGEGPAAPKGGTPAGGAAAPSPAPTSGIPSPTR
jgi:hypothetical protein